MRRVVGVLLAAGTSSRMGEGRNKLLEPIRGRPMLAWPLAALGDAGVAPRIVVLGHEAEGVRAALASEAGPEVAFEVHSGFRSGLGGSLAAGAAAARRRVPDLEGVLVVLGDLPELRAEHVRPVLEAFERAGPDSICVPVHRGRRGHPVLFGRAHLGALEALAGDSGARGLLERPDARLVEVEVGSDAVLRDVDTPAALAAARGSDRVGPQPL